MIKKYTNIILNFILIAGLANFILLTTTSSLSNATIWTIFVLYIWVLGSLYLGEFDFQRFIITCCYVGFLFSITYFLSFGLEEMPYPEGAIMFHSQPIAVSFLLFFFRVGRAAEVSQKACNVSPMCHNCVHVMYSSFSYPN